MSGGAADNLCGLFRAQASATPTSLAVISGVGARLTYRDLEARSDAIAARLRELGVRPEALVGVCLPRAADMVAALLGVWYAGGAYVPLDPDYPSDRIAYMMRDAGLDLVLTTRALAASMPPGARSVLVDELSAADVPGFARTLDSGATDQNLAYVIYTSGSTGHPKGVQVTRGAVANFLVSMASRPGLSAGDMLAAVTTLSFDIAVLELLLPPTVGATTIVLDHEVSTEGERLAQALSRLGATVMQATPSTWRMLLETGWSAPAGFKALCGGESLPPDLAEALTARASEVWNMYGPTETTVWSTCYRLPEGGRPVLIGRPIDNTRVYVLDPSMSPVPPGVQGEIFIAGAGLARGYLNQPERTAEGFLPDPFSAEPGARMYRTGDLGRYSGEGNVEHRGRADTQVKVRGFRIELGEIEAALTRHGGVYQAAAIVDTSQADDPRIVAYVVPKAQARPTHAELRRHLGAWLPSHMIPQHFVDLDALPLTPNRKVDRKRLPPVNRSPTHGTGTPPSRIVPPRTPTERAVVDAWRVVMGRDDVGADANFFDLGGHSVLAIRVVARLKKVLGVPLTLRQFFESPTVDGLSATIDSLLATAGRADSGSLERMVF